MSDQPNVLSGQECPICHKKTLSMTEIEKEIPFFGNMYIFSMSCSNCKYHKGDTLCQLIIMPVPKIKPIWVDELSDTERGGGGFGSTGN